MRHYNKQINYRTGNDYTGCLALIFIIAWGATVIGGAYVILHFVMKYW